VGRINLHNQLVFFLKRSSISIMAISEKTKEYHKKYSKAYREANPEKSKAYYESNKEKDSYIKFLNLKFFLSFGVKFFPIKNFVL